MTSFRPSPGGIIPRQSRWITRAILAALASINLSLAAQTTPAPSGGENEQPDQNRQPVVLDPFDVNSSTDVGYGASATASSGRLVQNYIDVPQTVNVVTSELIEDFNLQDVRMALEYTPDVTFGLTDNPNNDRIRGAIVTSTYIDGVAMPNSYSALPMDFFDRIEVVKGPSSVAFGLGQPGGLFNYVSKTPQGTDATSLSFGVGTYDNYLARFDTQGISAKDPKLSYRLVGFWDSGDYPTPGTEHSGAGAQLSLRYDFNKTTHLDLIVSYSHTIYPANGNTNNIWLQETIYQTWEGTNLGNPIYLYLKGTVLPNGSVFGVSGTLPPPGTEVGLLGTGTVAGADSNPAPQGWDTDTENTSRNTLVLTKEFADGHWNLRNALTLAFNQSVVYDTGPNGVLALPGSANTLPAAAAGNPYYGEPNGISPITGGQGYPTSPGQPGDYYFGISYSHVYTSVNASVRDDELDLLGNYHFFGGDWQTLVGADFYDNESFAFGYQEPSINANGTAAYPTEYSNNNPPPYISSTYDVDDYNSTHSWGDGFYAQEDASFSFGRIGSLDLLAGWRIDYFDTETNNYATSQAIRPGWVNTKGAPRFAVTYKPVKWLSVYELYTKHADPTQSTNKYFLVHGTEWTGAVAAEFPQAELEFFQPGGYTVESGLKASFLGGKLNFSVAVFHEITTGQLNSIVVYNATQPDGTNLEIGTNEVQGLNAHGVEAELFGQPFRRLSFTADYGITRGYYPAFSNGLPDWLDASSTLSGHGKFDLGNLRGTGFYVTFGGEWFSPYYIYESSSFYEYYTTSQYLVDGGIGYRWRNGKYRESLYFNMDNVMNQIVSIGSVTPWTIEPLRSCFLTYKVSY